MLNDSEKYEQIINNLMEIIKSKNLEIHICNNRISDLTKKLKQAEQEGKNER